MRDCSTCGKKISPKQWEAHKIWESLQTLTFCSHCKLNVVDYEEHCGDSNHIKKVGERRTQKIIEPINTNSDETKIQQINTTSEIVLDESDDLLLQSNFSPNSNNNDALTPNPNNNDTLTLEDFQKEPPLKPIEKDLFSWKVQTRVPNATFNSLCDVLKKHETIDTNDVMNCFKL